TVEGEDVERVANVVDLGRVEVDHGDVVALEREHPGHVEPDVSGSDDDGTHTEVGWGRGRSYERRPPGNEGLRGGEQKAAPARRPRRLIASPVAARGGPHSSSGSQTKKVVPMPGCVSK